MVALVLLLLPGAIVAQDPLASPEVYQLFLDWLSGRSMALITFNIEPVDQDGRPVSDQFMVLIHNFTRYGSKSMSERIEAKGLRHSIRIWRLLNIFNEWEEHEYTIVLAGSEYFGAKLVRIRPEKPIMELRVKIPVERVGKPAAKAQSIIEAQSSSCVPCASRPPDSETKTVTALTKALQVHTINGVTVYVKFYSGNYLYFSQKARHFSVYTPPGQGTCCYSFQNWITTGDKLTPCDNDVATTSLSNGESRWLLVYVTYKYERWLYRTDPAPVFYYYELVTPISFGGYSWGESKQCTLCGSQPSGWIRGYPKGTPTPIQIDLGEGTQEVEEIGARVTFTVSYGPVTVSVELWKKIERGGSYTPPKLVISSIQWTGDILYAFDADSGKKIIYFTWG
ncbi:MAG: hypothetical protein QXL64_03150 [Thermofilaceae archaeon]